MSGVPRNVTARRETLAPTRTSERIQSLDIIRAIALFGVLAMHVTVFSGQLGMRLLDAEGRLPANGIFDQTAFYAIGLFLVGKAYAIFSMLFGIGLYLQLERAKDKGLNTTLFTVRRLGALFLIGCIHRIFIWSGDILVTYALVGTLLPVFMKFSARTCILFAVLLLVGVTSFPIWSSLFHLDPGSLSLGQNTHLLDAADKAKMATRVMHKEWSPYLIAAAQRASRFRTLLVDELPLILATLPLFLVGVTIWKKRIPASPEKFTRFFKVFIAIGTPVGLAVSLFAVNPFHLFPDATLYVFHGGIWLVARDVAALILGATYFMGLVWLIKISPTWASRLNVLAPMGRMALTNYLCQSLVLTTIFTKPGFGLYNALSMRLALTVLLINYTVQVVVSKWWLSRFQFGPVEWIWRSATYWKIQPMRKFVIAEHTDAGA